MKNWVARSDRRYEVAALRRPLATIAILLALASQAVAQTTGYQGMVMFASNCVNSPQLGRSEVCYDSGVNSWFAWNPNATPPAFQPIGGGTVPASPCGDSSHALSWNGTAYGCQAITGSATPGGTNGAIQYNNTGALGGAAITGIVKGNGTSAPTAATAGTDYQAPISGNTLGAHNFANSISSAGAITGAQPGAADISAGTFTGAFTFGTPPTLSGANVTTGTLSPAALSGAVPVNKGGTGATSASAATANAIGAAAEGANTDITSLGGLTTPITVAQGGMPAFGSACNMPFDAITGWVSLTPSGDFACGASTGQLTDVGWEGFPFTAAFPANTAGYTGITNSSSQIVPTQLPTDACSSVGCLNTVKTAATPNVYDPINPVNLGDVLTDNGPGSEPTNQPNEAPQQILFGVDGADANSTNRYAVCPATLRVSPGLQTVYPTVSSWGIVSSNPAQVDTFTFNDITGSTTMALGYVSTSGVVTFGSPSCSGQFDGTQGGAAFNRNGGPTINVTIPAGAASSSAGLLVCSTLGNDGSFTTPSGWTPVTGGSFSGTGISTIVYEANPLGSGSTAPGATATCTYSTTHTSGAAVYTFKGGPASGEVVDVINATRSASTTSVSWPSVTTTKNGDFMMYVVGSGINTGVLSAPSAPLVLGQTSNGQGVATMYGGAAGVMAAQTGTVTTGSHYDVSIGILSGSTTCTLCTAGDKLEMVGPTTGTQGNDPHFTIRGVK